MGLAKYEIVRAYSPYRKEALYCFVIDIITVFVCSAVFILIGIPHYAPLLFLVFPTYLVVEILINYRLAVLSILEEWNQIYVLKDILIVGIKIEDSASGRWGSVIPKLYPKELGIKRYKIKCIDSNKAEMSLRCVMSNKNAKLLSSRIDSESALLRTVVIGRYSRIILKYCDKDDLALVLNRTM